MKFPNWRQVRKHLPALREFTPQTLLGRSMLIIVLPIAIMQLAVVFVFFDRHWQSVSTSLSEGVVGDIAVVLQLYKETPETIGFDDVSVMASNKMGLSVALLEDEFIPTSSHFSFNSPLDRTLQRALAAKIGQPFWFDTTRYPAYIDIQIQVDDGVMRFIAPREKVYATTGNMFVLWLVGATLLLTGIAILFTRAQLRPILQLANAAERLGKGLDNPDFKPSGAMEVRQASSAFVQMQQRISRFVNQRTEMLAGVSHDLRTPLTRLKLQFAMMQQTPELVAARKDLNHMQQMLDGYLDFARGEAQAVPVQVDLTALLEQLVTQIVPQQRLSALELPASLPVLVRAQSMERCITNLLENAVRYGGQVWVSGYATDGQVLLRIEDDGPGIDAALREEVFRPFNRLDAARNLNTEGVGLGLTIARDAARAHGGDIQLSRSKHGGLQVELCLPEPEQERQQIG
ncbi:Osmolarity sensor protein EnvZ [hydrothermal vent metagenome]|uniref:histidine kinase n=1 Tax=hydrothermal vent metagenome TaxID=652676 RepID=A0A3B0R682_9ZZZZ